MAYKTVVEEGSLPQKPVLGLAVARIQPSDHVKSGPSCSEIAAGAWMAWTAVCCLPACFFRARTANTENERSIKELGWPGGLVSLSDGQKELGCVSCSTLAPTPLPAFPSQGWYPVNKKLLGTRMFPNCSM